MWLGEPHPLPKEDRPLNWARRDNKVTKGDRVEHVLCSIRTVQFMT